MKVKLELFGASRDFSNKDHLEFNIKEQLEIKDFRKEIINYLDKNFKGNEGFIKIVNPHLRIDNVKLLIKEGGKSGLWINPDGLPGFLKDIF